MDEAVLATVFDIIQEMKVINVIDEDSGEEKLYYIVTGINEVRLFGLIKVEAPVEVQVDIETGETVSVFEPWYLRVFGWLFSGKS
ncbi:hypothetical protein ACFL1U_00780 [Patescibacteria group bacterium]